MRLRWVLDKLGTAAIVVAVVLLLAIVKWMSACGRGGYGDPCRFNLGCHSYACVHRALRGDAQVAAHGMCTRPCSDDAECGDGARCAALSEEAQTDLPPFGKPERACFRIENPIDREGASDH